MYLEYYFKFVILISSKKKFEDRKGTIVLSTGDVKQQSINVRDYGVLYYNAVRLVIGDGWNFIHTWKALARLHHFTYRGGLGPQN